MPRPSGPIVKTFDAPFSGLYRSLPPHAIPPTAASIASNVLFSIGTLIARPGFLKLSQVGGLPSDPSFAEDPLGIGYMITSTGNLDIYVAAETNLWRLRSLTGSWTDISGSVTLTMNPAADRARFASLYDSATGNTSGVFVTGTDPMVRTLDGGNFATVSGVDNAIDVATAASRIMTIIPPYRVWWSDIFNSASYPSLNFYTATDTPGQVIAIRNLGALGAVIYKQDCIIVAYSQPGTPANAFRFEVRAEVAGPASPRAVVVTENGHFYMTHRGRIGLFDGARFSWIGDGAWPTLLQDYDFANSYQTTGFYDPMRGLVVFHYPRLSDSGNGPTGLAIVTLARPEWGVTSYGVWPGVTSWPVSCATSAFLSTGGVGIVGRGDTGMINIWDHNTRLDQGTAYPCVFQTGLQAVGNISKVDIEPFLARGVSAGDVNLAAVTSYDLHDLGTVAATQNIDLEDLSVVRDTKGFNASGRFVGLRLTWDSDDAFVQYLGAVVNGYGVD